MTNQSLSLSRAPVRVVRVAADVRQDLERLGLLHLVAEIRNERTGVIGIRLAPNCPPERTVEVLTAAGIEFAPLRPLRMPWP